MSLGKTASWVDESYRTFQEEVAGALDNKEFLLLEAGTAANSIKLNATAGNEIGVMFQKLQNATGRKDDINVRMLGKEGTVKLIQNAGIAYGARVYADPSAPTKVIAVPATAGVYRSIGRKVSEGSGAQNDVIEVLDLAETVRVNSADTLSALTFTAGGATGPQVEALRDAVKAILEAQKLMA